MKKLFSSIICVLMLVSCSDFLGKDTGNVTLKFSPYTQVPNTKAVALEDVFSKLNIMIFDNAGNKVLTSMKTQIAGDDDFGTASFSLEDGTYTVVAVGHSNTKNATITSPTEVAMTAANGVKYTDTFACSIEIQVEGKNTYDATLNRMVGMFRLVMSDQEIDDQFVRIEFKYSGYGKFNPKTGLSTGGKGTQTEKREKNSSGIYEIYLVQPEDGKKLKITATAYDKDSNELTVKVFDEVPITTNMITEYKGSFFGGEVGSGNQISFSVDPTWKGTTTYDYE